MQVRQVSVLCEVLHENFSNWSACADSLHVYKLWLGHFIWSPTELQVSGMGIIHQARKAPNGLALNGCRTGWGTQQISDTMNKYDVPTTALITYY